VVPYIRLQLEHLDIFEEEDGGDLPHDPIRVHGELVGRDTPALYVYSGDSSNHEPWQLTYM
jgi:hypothetical protein